MPNQATALLGMLALLAGLLVTIQGATRLSLFILVILGLVTLPLAAAYVVLARSSPIIEGGRDMARFPHLKRLAIGVFCVEASVLLLLATASSPRRRAWHWFFPDSSPRIEIGVIKEDPGRVGTGGSSGGYSVRLTVHNPSNDLEIISRIKISGVDPPNVSCYQPGRSYSFSFDGDVSIRAIAGQDAIAASVRETQEGKEAEYAARAHGYLSGGECDDSQFSLGFRTDIVMDPHGVTQIELLFPDRFHISKSTSRDPSLSPGSDIRPPGLASSFLGESQFVAEIWFKSGTHSSYRI